MHQVAIKQHKHMIVHSILMKMNRNTHQSNHDIPKHICGEYDIFCVVAYADDGTLGQKDGD